MSVAPEIHRERTTGRVAPAQRWVRRVTALENSFLVLVLLAMILGFTLASPPGTFFSGTNLTNVALDTSEILILGAGQTFIIIAAGLDLSIGSVVVFTSVVGALVTVQLSGTAVQVASGVYPHLATGLVIGVAAALLSGCVWGFVNGYITVTWGVPPFVVTLGTLGMAVGFAQILTGGLNVPNVPPQIQTSYGSGSLFGVPWLVVTAIVVVAVLWIILAQTRYGLRTYAIGASPEAARRAGVNVKRHVLGLYVLMGLLDGIVGVMDVARFDTASIFAHTQDNLTAIAAVVIGGTSLFGGRGRMSGTIIGAFLPAIPRNGFILVGVQPFWQNVAIGAVLIIAVYMDQVRRRRLRVA